MHEHAIIALTGIGLLSIACQWFAWWVKLPAILFLLLGGIVVGPVTGWLDPDALFGDLLFPLVSLSVAVILFEGSLTLKLHEIRGLEQVVRRMVTSGLAVTWFVTTVATHWLLSFPWSLAVLFGALTVVTGPTVIVPMLRTVRPTATVANILRWEGIVIDPIGAVLAVLVFGFIVSGQGGAALGFTLVNFAKTVATGLAIGGLSGYLLGELLRRHWLPDYLHNVATLTLMFGAFTAANVLHAESGLITVTVMGLWLANMRGVHINEILDFKESLSVLLISGLFVILAARIRLEQFQALGWAAVGVFLAMQFVARPLKVAVATAGSSLSWRERALLAWIAPRGIVAAAIAALFAIRLEQTPGFEAAQQAPLLVPLTFLVIIGTVLLQSATARMVAGWLGVAEPEPKGVLIVGANAVARIIARALQQKGYRVLLTDTNWDHIRAARMEGLSNYHGNVVSEHADRNLDLIGIGRMLALTPQGEFNALAGMRYRREFGRKAVYALQTTAEKEGPEKLKVAAEHRGYDLFGEDVTYSTLASFISEGAEIRSTTLDEELDFEAYQQRDGGQSIDLFALTPRGRLEFFVVAGKLKPARGWTIVSLAPVQSEQEKGSTETALSAR